ncbi:MAG: hypothetical protein U0V56_13485 [Actinomycetota bacterium]
MLTGAVAKEQIRDRIEAASADRVARAVAHRGRIRMNVRVAGSGLAAVMRATGRARPRLRTRAGTTTA